MKDIAVTVILALIFGGGVGCLYKYRRDLLFKIALKYVQEAEEYFGSKAGREKLVYASEKIKQVTPWWLDPLISDELLATIINEVVDYLQDTFKYSKAKQIAVVNEMVRLSDTNRNVTKSAKAVMEEIDKKGYVEAYAEVKSNLHGEQNAEAGIRAGVKF